MKPPKVNRRNPPVNLTLPPELVQFRKDYAQKTGQKYLSNLVARELQRLKDEDGAKNPLLQDAAGAANALAARRQSKAKPRSPGA